MKTALITEEERRLISWRTRDALQAAKARGVKLGGLNAKGIQNRDEARQRAELLRPMLAELAGGAMQCIPLEGIAAKCPYGSAMARFGYLRSTCNCSKSDDRAAAGM